MKKVALVDYGRLELQETAPLDALLPGTVKVRVRACGICGSDIALFRGQRSLTDEHYFGHEFSGVVTDPGEGVGGLKTGTRVASELSRTCGRCWYCRNGMPNYCRSMNEALLPGGFSQETLILNTPDYSFLSPIPDTLDDVTATLLEPTSCAYRIASQAALKPGETVLVFGLGAMGLITARILKSWGAGTIAGVDTNGQRLDLVRGLGWLEGVDRGDPRWRERVEELCGAHGADVVIEATGVSQVLQDAFQAVRPGGRIVVGSVYSAPAQEFQLWPIMRKELTLIGAKGPYPQHLTDGSSAVVQTVNRLQEDLRKLITVYPYEKAEEAFADMMSGCAIKAVITF